MGLDAQGDQWGPLILLHLAHQESPERKRDGVRPSRKEDPRTPDHRSQDNRKLSAS